MTPTQQAQALLQRKGLTEAIQIARELVRQDKRVQRRTDRSRFILGYLQTLADALAELTAIERADPVAELAAKLVDAGIDEESLHAALKGEQRLCSPVGNELFNKYRDVSRWLPTTNHYQKTMKHGHRAELP